MENRFPETTIIRQYLLGQLQDRWELEESLSEEMFFNDELSEVVDSIEDEIIEEYLDGSMNLADKQSFEAFFLRPQLRRNKLQFAQLLREHFSENQGQVHLAGFETRPQENGNGLRAPFIPASPFWQVHARTLMEISALLILSSLCVFYFATMKAKIAESATNQRKLENELTQERQRSATLASQLDEALHPLALTLIAENVVPKFRSAEPAGAPRARQALAPSQSSQVARVTSGTQQINFDLILNERTPVAYNVDLENREEKRIWSTRVYPIIDSSAPDFVMSAHLRFATPVTVMADGEYSFAVSAATRSTALPDHYRFAVRKVK